jgi:hypothetical protein
LIAPYSLTAAFTDKTSTSLSVSSAISSDCQKTSSHSFELVAPWRRSCPYG